MELSEKTEQWKESILNSRISRKTAKEIVHTFFKIGEESGLPDVYAQAYDYERRIMNCVMNGDCRGLETLMEEERENHGSSQIGYMSDNPIRQATYMLVTCVTLTTRFAIAGGVPERDAYHLSDAYLQQADRATTEEKIIELIPAAFRQFTELVYKVKHQKLKSYPVAKAVRYINEHLYKKIDLRKLAEHCQVTPQYLSGAFHKEVGITITAYVRQEKLKVAEQMLVLSDYSVQTISDVLNFSTASYFCNLFKKQYGATPESWRIQNMNRMHMN